MFISKLADADGEATETQVWLDFAHDCGYLIRERHGRFMGGYEEVGRMLGGMMAHPERFLPLHAVFCLLLSVVGVLATASGFLPTACCLLLSVFWKGG